MSIGANMSGDADQTWTADRNQTTAGFDLENAQPGNVTDELYPLLDYINVTSLPDVNATEAIDSFYFYEVSKIATAFYSNSPPCET